jgi:ribosome biogenesis protein UTP30
VSGGTCSVVKVARVSQAREEIVENVKAVVEGVAQQIPKKWTNIRALFLKTLESVALPLYQSLPEMPLKIELPGLSQVKSTEPVKKKAKLGKGSKEKVGRLLKNEDKDKMDVVEDTVDAEKPKKRKRKDAEGKRKTLRAAN